MSGNGWWITTTKDYACKGNNNAFKVYKKVNEKNGQNKYEYEKEEEEIEVQCEGVIGLFVNNTLRIIDKNSNFQETHQEDLRIIVFSEEIKQAIVVKEAIAATDICKRWYYGWCVENWRFVWMCVN